MLTDRENGPITPLNWKPLKAVLKSLAMANATTLQKKTCQLRRLLQNEDKSSIANSRPPTGALKAAATPAATPAVVKARLEVSQKMEFCTDFHDWKMK